MILALLLSVSSSFVSNLYMEMSMDTYPYGVDPSPMLRTKNKTSVVIDSLGDYSLHGTVKGMKYNWDKNGRCDCNDSLFDLEYNELYYYYPNGNEK